MIYIHKDINFWKTKVKLPDSYLISTDIDDYEVGAYLPLSEEQEQYHNEHPDATPLECWHMQPTPEPEPTPEELLWRARDAKRQEIYDKDIHHYYIDEQDAFVQGRRPCGAGERRAGAVRRPHHRYHRAGHRAGRLQSRQQGG